MKDYIEKMREMEDILLEIVREAKKETAWTGAVKPVALEAAKILTELFYIEKDIDRKEEWQKRGHETE